MLEFTEVELMHLSCPNEHGRRGEQLSTAALKARKQQQHQYGGGRWGMRDVVIRLNAIRTN